MARVRSFVAPLALLILAFLPSEAAIGKNLVSDWNEVTQSVVSRYAAGSAAGRYHTFVHLSIYKALAGTPSKGSKVSKPAAANYAAHYVLSTLFPALQSPLFDGELRRQLKLLNLAGVSIPNSISFGKKYAIALLKERTNDGSQMYVDFMPSPAGGPPGKYQFTPGQMFALSPQLASAKQFLFYARAYYNSPKGPLKVYSQAYNVTVNEVRKIGQNKSSVRTAKQTETAFFWMELGGLWYNTTKALLPSSSSLLLVAKAYAIVSVSLFDAGIVSFHQKYKFLKWRPITAIRVDYDRNWTPLLSTPPHPEYPSGHSLVSATAAYGLAAALGKTVNTILPAFTVKSTYNGGSLPPRKYTSLNAMVAEIGVSRIYGGVHFRNAVEDGTSVGYKLGKTIVERFNNVGY